MFDLQSYDIEELRKLKEDGIKILNSMLKTYKTARNEPDKTFWIYLPDFIEIDGNIKMIFPIYTADLNGKIRRTHNMVFDLFNNSFETYTITKDAPEIESLVEIDFTDQKREVALGLFMQIFYLSMYIRKNTDEVFKQKADTIREKIKKYNEERMKLLVNNPSQPIEKPQPEPSIPTQIEEEPQPEPQPEPSVPVQIEEEPRPEPSAPVQIEEEPQPEPSILDELEEELQPETSAPTQIEEEPQPEPSILDELEEELQPETSAPTQIEEKPQPEPNIIDELEEELQPEASTPVQIEEEPQPGPSTPTQIEEEPQPEPSAPAQLEKRRINIHFIDYSEFDKDSHYEGKTGYTDIDNETTMEEILGEITELFGKDIWEAYVNDKLIAVCKEGKIDYRNQIGFENVTLITIKNSTSYYINKQINAFINELFPVDEADQMQSEQLQEINNKKHEIIDNAYEKLFNGEKVDLEKEASQYIETWREQFKEDESDEALFGSSIMELKNGNMDKGLEQLTKLADNYMPARCWLGVIYYTGQYGVEQDKEKGLNLIIDYYKHQYSIYSLYLLAEEVFLGKAVIMDMKCEYVDIDPVKVQYEKNQTKGIEIFNDVAEQNKEMKRLIGKAYCDGKFASGEPFIFDVQKGTQMLQEAKLNN